MWMITGSISILMTLLAWIFSIKKKPEQNLGCNRSDFIYGIDVISGMQNGMSMGFTRRLGSFIGCSSIRFRYFMQLYSRYYFS